MSTETPLNADVYVDWCDFAANGLPRAIVVTVCNDGLVVAPGISVDILAPTYDLAGCVYRGRVLWPRTLLPRTALGVRTTYVSPEGVWMLGDLVPAEEVSCEFEVAWRCLDA